MNPITNKMQDIIDFYGKYNEEKRLLTPYGRVEYLTTMHYIDACIAGRSGLQITEFGCATGRYSLEIAKKGHNVTAVDLVPYNIGILKQKAEREGIKNVTPLISDAKSVKKIGDKTQDIVLILGPLYHLFTKEEKCEVLKEAKRILKPGGTVMAGYILNEFGILTFGIKENHLLESLSKGKIDAEFHVRNDISDLFSFDRTEDLDAYNKESGFRLQKRIAQDGATNYLREEFKAMDEETFQGFLRYHLSTCERPDLIGAGCHVMDILTPIEEPV